jgi:hypothetical protein
LEAVSKAGALSRPRVIVWAKSESPRLSYVLDWLLNERLGLDYHLTTIEEIAQRAQFSLSYGWLENCFCVDDSSTLCDVGNIPARPDDANWNGLWAPYSSDSPCHIPFDLFAGIFYLLSRAEEYETFSPDRHGRYPATSSVLFEAGVLNRPVIDEWVEFLRVELQRAWSIEIPAVPFSISLTYDLDIPRKYEYKSAQRSIGAALRDLTRGRFSEIKQRTAFVFGKNSDPYNSFDWLRQRHRELNVRPKWFILAAQQSSDFDRNASPESAFMKTLIRELSKEAEIGVHPSYYSDVHPERMVAEKAVLERISGNEIFRSRQHFIRLLFPQTYHALIDAGIRVDYSMGYSTHFGFRAGTGHSFPWYDLSVEQTRALRIVPFAYMDTTARFDQNLTAQEALEKLLEIAENAKRVNGKLTTIFHNFSLGDDVDWKGWREMYEYFLGTMI